MKGDDELVSIKLAATVHIRDLEKAGQDVLWNLGAEKKPGGLASIDVILSFSRDGQSVPYKTQMTLR